MVKTETYRENASDNSIMGSGKAEMKRQYSTYEAPSLKEFLLVLLVEAILIALSWSAYVILGWFH